MSPQRSHDYPHLMRRWRALCRKSGLAIRQFAEADGYPCFEVSSPSLNDSDGIYISAGIHGDEAGATEGLIAWAESRAAALAKLPLLIYPCLNPWGLVNNSRTDAAGRDLNREWDSPLSAHVKAAVERIAGLSFRLVLTLHEDYDGQGLYIYEPGVTRRSQSWGDDLIAAAAPHIAPDPRRRIDGRGASGGVIRPRPGMIPQNGQPEAVYLYLHHCKRTFTFETPSEFAIERRAHCQVALMDAAIALSEEEAKAD